MKPNEKHEVRRKGREKGAEAPHVAKSPRAPQTTQTARVPERTPVVLPDDVLVGRNAIAEALKSGRGINRLLIADGDTNGSVSEIAMLARERGIVTEIVPRTRIESIAAGHRHQGVLAYVAPVPYASFDELLAKCRAKEAPLLILLDGLEDPHNLGAILRTADAAGADGVLLPKRRSVALSATVAKTSAGAVEYVPVAHIGNVVQTMKQLKEAGFWIAAADMDGAPYYEANFQGPLVLVIGGEGKGVARLTKEHCDFVVSMPMHGKINSLNASVAAAILMYEVVRQRAMR